jgi:hypothetical protein
MKANRLVTVFVLMPLVAFPQKQSSAYPRETSAVMSARDRNIQVILEEALTMLNAISLIMFQARAQLSSSISR